MDVVFKSASLRFEMVGFHRIGQWRGSANGKRGRVRGRRISPCGMQYSSDTSLIIPGLELKKAPCFRLSNGNNFSDKKNGNKAKTTIDFVALNFKCGGVKDPVLGRLCVHVHVSRSRPHFQCAEPPRSSTGNATRCLRKRTRSLR